MAKEMRRPMHVLFLPAARRYSRVLWQPSADVYQTRDGWLVKFDLAGVRPEDIQLQCCGRHLTVSGTRRDCTTTEGCCHYQLEIAYSHFERTLELPMNLEQAQFATRYQDGMLLIRIQTEAHS